MNSTFSDAACLLVTHGSRDPRPEIALDHLVKLMSDRSPNYLIGTAQLELAPEPLHQQILRFAQLAIDRGKTRLQILPLFLLAGVHVMEDIPAEVALARSKQLDLAIEILPHTGQHPDFWKLLINPVDEIGTSPHAGKILLAHGSRREGANQPIVQIAAQLRAMPAFWSVEPNLETQATNLIRQGCQEICVLPYFLFEGGITDAIEQQVQQIAQQFPYVKLHLGRAIGASPALADFLLALIDR
ncbi:sirohydrochlorin chelatase [Leptolyngbya ohadii]|uniref:sirohydrochlorin chelatase n=1 Tax=Leptolyngbya ohadii TaxID=1962290 RepID=UPI0019D4D196|nr:sirohydrochlorin chelatase [Leptolyngbya ohadii]